MRNKWIDNIPCYPKCELGDQISLRERKKMCNRSTNVVQPLLKQFMHTGHKTNIWSYIRCKTSADRFKKLLQTGEHMFFMKICSSIQVVVILKKIYAMYKEMFHNNHKIEPTSSQYLTKVPTWHSLELVITSIT